MLEMELRKAPGGRSVPHAPRRARSSSDVAAVVATVGTTSTTSVDPVPAIAERCARSTAPGCTWTPPTPARRWSAPSFAGRSRGVERADSLVVNAAQVAVHADGLLLLLTSRPDDLRAAFRLVPEYLRTTDEDALNISEYGPGARPPLPLAQALGGAALLRARGPAGADPRGDAAGDAVRGLGRADEPGCELCAPRPFSIVCFRREGSDEENEALLERVNCERRDLPLAHEAERPLRPPLAIGNARTTEDDVRRAWDVLRRLLTVGKSAITAA